MKALSVLMGFVILAVLATPVVQAGVSLGSVQVDKVKGVYPGEDAAFKVLLFNLHGEGTLKVGLSADYPPGWGIGMPVDVDIPKTEIVKLPEPETGFEFINTEGGYIKAKPVVIGISVPESAQPGSYDIKVSARTLGGGDATLSVSQSRSFSFRVIVGEEDVPEEPGDGSSGESQGTAGVSTGSQPVDDIFVIDQDNEGGNVSDDDRSEEVVNETGQEEVADFVDSVTGAITANPVYYPVFILMFMVFLLGFLKMKKRI
ncbi:MAG: hypothetical protein ACXABY_27190 [Candidatus Thorarchaeota archaeon]|jgi:hypothetical protein